VSHHPDTAIINKLSRIDSSQCFEGEAQDAKTKPVCVTGSTRVPRSPLAPVLASPLSESPCVMTSHEHPVPDDGGTPTAPSTLMQSLRGTSTETKIAAAGLVAASGCIFGREMIPRAIEWTQGATSLASSLYNKQRSDAEARLEEATTDIVEESVEESRGAMNSFFSSLVSSFAPPPKNAKKRPAPVDEADQELAALEEEESRLAARKEVLNARKKARVAAGAETTTSASTEEISRRTRASHERASERRTMEPRPTFPPASMTRPCAPLVRGGGVGSDPELDTPTAPQVVGPRVTASHEAIIEVLQDARDHAKMLNVDTEFTPVVDAPGWELKWKLRKESSTTSNKGGDYYFRFLGTVARSMAECERLLQTANSTDGVLMQPSSGGESQAPSEDHTNIPEVQQASNAITMPVAEGPEETTRPEGSGTAGRPPTGDVQALSLMHAKISVWWPQYSRHFLGTVDQVMLEDGAFQHRIVYASNDQQWHVLSEWEYDVIESPGWHESGHDFIGRHIARQLDAGVYKAQIELWLPASEDEVDFFWVRHEDGDDQVIL
jgi:hypothetical protein